MAYLGPLGTYSFAKTPFNAAKVPLVMARRTQGEAVDGLGGVDMTRMVLQYIDAIYTVTDYVQYTRTGRRKRRRVQGDAKADNDKIN